MKLSYALLFLFCVFSAFKAEAQDLKRRAYLGLHATSLPDSLAKRHGLSNGLLVAGVAPKSTAETMGIRKGDVLLSINKRQLNKTSDLTELAKTLYPGQALATQLVQNGKRNSIKGTAIARPLEVAPNTEVVFSQVPFQDGLLRTITYKPRKEGKHPAILFIPGFPCRSIDDYGSSSYSQLVKGWSELGYIVMLVEKPGLGDNVNTPDCLQIDLYAEIEAFEQGLKGLQNLPEVDKENVFIFGHSMGGIIAPVLTQKYQLKGVMVYGSPYRPWFEFAADMFRFQKPVTGTDYVAHEETMRHLHHVLYRFFVLGQHPDTIATADPAYKKILQEEFQHTGGDMFWSRDYRYWQEIDELNLTKAWAETDEAVLSIWGEYDFEVVHAEDHKRIVEVVNHYHPGNATFLTMPKTNHSLIEVSGMAEGVKQMSKRDLQYNKSHFNTKIVTDTDQWMRAVMTTK
ncbi:PDZ domain-containing protein [Pontibacter ummariensis]|uniref:PDZ domain-containing protein n=1 Tax=Pontibacter ummariensis TaxID=1610492 RepID=A0A239IWP6_9BACT|nr:alpha/beta fold hydrolase [Pontibacter ummariensis]PRY09000.1 PDZ domain-containing protein [Pontibacter ummariensis]SNS98040.1 PDZ domain-containing protein [Pontibacter ummariensis]